MIEIFGPTYILHKLNTLRKKIAKSKTKTLKKKKKLTKD